MTQRFPTLRKQQRSWKGRGKSFQIQRSVRSHGSSETASSRMRGSRAASASEAKIGKVRQQPPQHRQVVSDSSTKEA